VIGEIPLQDHQIIRSIQEIPKGVEYQKQKNSDQKRHFPWLGDANPENANFDQTGIGNTSSVGCFPNGRSPYGCEEMSGNVWEWCRTKWRENYRTPEDNKLDGGTARVLRGGSFFRSANGVRCSNRLNLNPGYGYYSDGFRLALSPSSVL
jgi:formylglycine-generating enzyme required for sulfatase activity